ncbi:DUF418 domain-containing protein [Massilia scottii]|uniref:DUF418 domain-containing protein n=1 Tax=Massilia scottii TaxID=3057166 RepID=UPI002796B82D|nr:DUF418 domain-containing protein [Massilia sp. CCM 9029]MDQ1829781.1 DUF418 domain-containing protein [Massilia sp. CCM 9029]
MGSTAPRLDVVDALRGFAIVSIMLLHNIEHFDLYYVVPDLPAWLVVIDKIIWECAFFLFGGKSYAIFALLFGLTFHLQSQRRAGRGEDFRARYGWRLLILFGFGLLNSMFYHGDILTIYAVIGLCLLPVARMRDGVVLALAAALMLQPYAWLVLADAMRHPDAKIGDPVSWQYFARMNAYLTGDSLLRVWAGNLTNGKLAVIHWSWENGRVFQIMSLFMLGMLAGRRGLFEAVPASLRFWRRTLAGAALLFIPLFAIKTMLPDLVASAAVRRPLGTIIASWSNVAFMLVLVACFVLLYQRGAFTRALRVLAPLGRMSLTSYFTQSIIGSFIYYGFGLGLYKVTGATVCLLIGVLLAALQCAFCAWWLRRHAQGPLERLWHRATWISARQPA